MKGIDEYERKKIRTLKRAAMLHIRTFCELTCWYINMKGNDEYEREKICEI